MESQLRATMLAPAQGVKSRRAIRVDLHRQGFHAVVTEPGEAVAAVGEGDPSPVEADLGHLDGLAPTEPDPEAGVGAALGRARPAWTDPVPETPGRVQGDDIHPDDGVDRGRSAAGRDPVKASAAGQALGHADIMRSLELRSLVKNDAEE